jgi:hypothetical protein
MPFFSEKIIPEQGFIRKYIDYVSLLSDSPEEFAILNSFGLLSIISRQCVISRNGINLRPNIWVMILAASTIYHKTEAINISHELLSLFAYSSWEEKNKDGEIKKRSIVFPQEFTKEKFFEILAEQNYGIIFSEEFAGFMSMMQKDYMGGTKNFLATLYDSPPFPLTRGTKAEGIITIPPNPYLVMMTASSLTWFHESATGIDAGGGFLNRFIICSFKGRKTRVIPYWDRIKAGDKKIELVLMMNEIHNLIEQNKNGGSLCQFTITDEAVSFSNNKEIEYEEQIMDKLQEGDDTTFIPRIPTQAIKLSALYALSEKRFLIKIKDMERAWCFLELLRENTTKELQYLSEDKISQKWERRTQLILSKIKNNPGITRRILYNKVSGLSSSEMNKIEDSLIDAEKIEIRNEQIDKKTVRSYYIKN